MSNLKRIRENIGMTRKELAQSVGISIRTLQDYEQGHKPINRAAGIVLYNMAGVMGCKIEEILEIEEGENKPC